MNVKPPFPNMAFLSGREEEQDVMRWRIASDCAGQCIWDHDFERDLHFLSPAWREMRGLCEDEPIPSSTEAWLDTLHPDDVPGVLAELEKQNEGATDDVKYEFRQKHKNGKWLWILSRGRIVRRDAANQPVRIIGIDLDITDMKMAEVEKKRAGERLSVALKAAQMARWEHKIGSGSTFWDDRALEIFGISDGKNDRPAADFEKSLHPDDRVKTVDYWQSCLENKSDISCDFRILRPDGSERYVRTVGSYVPSIVGDGQYSGVNIDLTEDYRQREALEKTRAQLHHDSRHDALTGLANRRQLDEAYLSACENLPATNVLAAIHVDLDHFKATNDTLGHEAGDAVLVHVAHILKTKMPSNALISRVGGDEFVVFFDDAPAKMTLTELVRDLLTALSEPFYYDTNICFTGVSIGISTGSPSNSDNRSLFINADLALYEVKQSGRSSFQFFNGRMRQRVQNRRAAQEKLRSAIENGELTCHYQPQFDAGTLALTGIEALVRWECPDRGLVYPDAFLKPAAEMGLSSAIDDFVLAKAIDDLNWLDRRGLQIEKASVNLSTQRVMDPLYCHYLMSQEIPADRVSFELLESTFLDDQDDTLKMNLDTIREMGISIEIDDFGTGHASIVSLLQINPDRLKIDRALVDPILTSSSHKKILESLIQIGRLLKISVVAEGVETQDHIALLQEMGCDYLQGYALARPMPKEKLLGCFNTQVLTATSSGQS